VPHDASHVVESDRLKVQAVAGVEVSADGFRVVVDDQGAVARFAQRPNAVNTRVIELNPLPDADGAGPQDQNRLRHGSRTSL